MDCEVISLLDFLRSLPSAFDSYLVKVCCFTWVKCSECSKEYCIVDELYSCATMRVLDYRKKNPESENEYLHHLIYPDLFNVISSEFTIFIKENEISIRHFLWDYDNLDYVCKTCKENNVSQ